MCFRETRDALLIANDLEIIDDEELLLLLEVNTPTNLDIPYWRYDNFDLDSLSDDECRIDFRFNKHDIYSLLDSLKLPEKITCSNGSSVYNDEALCMLLRRFAYPCRHEDLVPRFEMVVNQTMDLIFDKYSHLLSDLNQPWLAQARLSEFAQAIHQKGAALDHCWGFIGSTVQPVCRHGKNHSIKFQSVVAPNGLIANLFGPVEGRRHDSGILAASKLLPRLKAHCIYPLGQPLCVYGGPAYPLRVHLQVPFKGALITPMEHAFNQSMSEVRDSVEWVFRAKKNLKVGLSAVGKTYVVCALLSNAHSCTYGSSISRFFGVDPPSIENYFI